jgi:hypothetical protein
MNIKPDITNVALWERFSPVQDGSEDWLTYTSFPDAGGDSLGKRIRFLSLAQLVRQVKDVRGHFAECGCFAGHSAYVIARTLRAIGRSERFAIFDSFEGLSPRAPEDKALSPRHHDIFGFQESMNKGETLFACDLATTRRNLAEFPFIEFYPGWIPTRFAEVEVERFAFVHIDVDVYEPTRDALAFFYPRLSEGGIIQIDDYNLIDWPGSTKAVDEFLETARPRLFYQIPLGGAFLVK